MTSIKMRRLLLLLLLCLFVANVPICLSQFVFRPARNFPILREARREAFLEEPGGWKKTRSCSQCIEKIAESAAEQANVTSTNIIQAFFKVRTMTKRHNGTATVLIVTVAMAYSTFKLTMVSPSLIISAMLLYYVAYCLHLSRPPILTSISAVLYCSFTMVIPVMMKLLVERYPKKLILTLRY